MADTANNKKKKRKKRLRKVIVWLILLAILGAVGYFILWPQLTASATITYDTYTARTGTISNALSFSGSVSVKNSETLSADASAVVRKIYVTERQKVSRDDKLIRLSNGTTLKAGFDGEVNEISVEEGDSVSMNASLIQIVDFEHMTISMRVDEYSISDLEVGQECTVTITALGEAFDSQIAQINRIPTGMGSTAYYTVTVELSVSEKVLPGMQATVSIPMEEAVDAVILNKNALTFGRDNSAYVLMQKEDGTMEQVSVEVGVDNDNYVAIVAGLKDGDTVYKQTESTAAAAGGLASLFTSLTGGMGGGFDFSSMPGGGSSGFGGSSFGGGGMPSMPSGFGGGGGGGGRGR